MTPLVSVITPSFNSRLYLQQCLDSVAHQSMEDFEHIVVDDASTDGSQQLLLSHAAADPRVKAICLTENRGVRDSRNIALMQAQGRYIAFLDSDDWWDRRKLELQLQDMRQRNLSVSTTAYQLVDESGKILGIRVPGSVINYRQLLVINQIGLSTGIYDRERTGKIFCFHPFGDEDHAVWLEITRRGQSVGGMSEVLSYYRRHRQASSRNKLAAALRRWQTYRYCERLNMPASAALFCFYAVQSLQWRFNGWIKRLMGSYAT